MTLICSTSEVNMSNVMAVMKKAVLNAAIFTETVRSEIRNEDALLKSDNSPVTIADIGAQIIITHTLLNNMGNLYFIAEEDLNFFKEMASKDSMERLSYFFDKSGFSNIFHAFSESSEWIKEPGEKDPFFAVDPIDGTKGFLRGSQYSIALAYVSDRGEVVASTLAAPLFQIKQGESGVLFSARKYEYSLWQSFNNERVHVVSPVEREKKFVVSYEKTHSNEGKDAEIAAKLSLLPEPLKLDSQLKYAFVAAGFASLYIRTPRETIPEEKIWDHAAGALILEEAGGKVFDAQGKKHIYRPDAILSGCRGVCAFAGLDEEEVLSALKF